MTKKAENLFKEIQDKLAQTLRDLPPILGNEAVNFISENFDRQAWNGEKWLPRSSAPWGKKHDNNRALLVQTGKLRRSIRIAEIHRERVTIIVGGADVPYARTHNEGFQGQLSQTVNPFLRRSKKGKMHGVKSHSRELTQGIPKRQFIGGASEAPELVQRIRIIVEKELKKTFN